MDVKTINCEIIAEKLKKLFPLFYPNSRKGQQEKEWVRCMLFFLEFEKIVKSRGWRLPYKAFCNEKTRKEFLTQIKELMVLGGQAEKALMDACSGYLDDFQTLYNYFTQMGVSEFFTLSVFKENDIRQKYIDKALRDKRSALEILWMIFLVSDSYDKCEDVYQKYCKYCGTNSLDLESFLTQFGQFRSLCGFPQNKRNASSQAQLGIDQLRKVGADDLYIEEQYVHCRRYIMKEDWKKSKRKLDVKYPFQYIGKCVGRDSKIRVGFEDAVDEAVKHFAQVKEPARFLETLRFPGAKSDAGIECGFALHEFEKIIDACAEEDRFLLVDPTPAFLDELQKAKPQIAERVTVAARNDLEVEILSHGYPQFCVCNFEDAKNEDRQEKKYAGIAVFARNDAPSVLKWAFSKPIAADDAKIVALFPLQELNDSQELRQKMMETYPWVELFLLPRGSSSTEPKKKVIICGARGKREGVKIVGLELIACEGKKYLTNSPGRLITVRSKEFQTYSGRTVHDLFGEVLTRKAPNGERKSVSQFPFSKEIMICYRPEKPTIGKKMTAYIREYPTSEQRKRHSNGKLRKETICTKKVMNQSDISSWLMDSMPYQSRVQNVCKETFQEARKEKAGQITGCPWLSDDITLKTVWYLSTEDIDDLQKEGLNPVLENQKRLMDSSVGKLDTGTDFSVLQSSMEQYFEENSFKAEEKEICWKSLSKIFSRAIAEGYCESNPVAEFLRQKKNSETNNIRQALAKKTFTRTEMKRMWNLLESEEEDGKTLSVQVRLMTGLELNVVAGLKWGDLRALDLPENDQSCQSVYQLCLSRQVLNNATTCKGFDEKEDYRRIPIVSALAKKLLMHKQRIMEKFGVKDFAIKDLFICYTDEQVEKSLHSKPEEKKEYPSPRKLQGYARKVVTKLGIEEDVLILPDADKGKKETNLANYGGDIFKANFRFYCRQVCGMRQEDEDYLLGIRQKTTYGKHYCDFSNDYIQLALFYELERWAADLLGNTEQDIRSVTRQDRSLGVRLSSRRMCRYYVYN